MLVHIENNIVTQFRGPIFIPFADLNYENLYQKDKLNVIHRLCQMEMTNDDGNFSCMGNSFPWQMRTAHVWALKAFGVR